jgi:hypothetical protein
MYAAPLSLSIIVQKRWLKFVDAQPEKAQVILQQAATLERPPFTKIESRGSEEEMSATERNDEDAGAKDTSAGVHAGLTSRFSGNFSALNCASKHAVSSLMISF